MLNHKFLLLLVVLLCASFSFTHADVKELEPVPIKHVNQQNLDGAGQYNHEIEVNNGIRASAKGNVNSVQGEYFLPGEEGPIRVTYTADATGFHPHIN
ncbi:pupal cuticle protein Edg-78E [Drosophila mojavensis]|uniref:Uncharacterized protein n=1 Tax=Drosophila mojavensis TaxID=7230 RepID=B4KTD5_DROMO|nr:pupal cuticle protein Edg-78E [Drosophila mojavensis]EDW08496.1 uncharacterized protein Dmoj_GI19542 [Drosophila mojavensis]